MNKAEITDINVHRFFKGCVWDFKTYPDEEIAKYFSRKRKTVVDLTGLEDTQLYYDIRDIFISCIVNGEPYSYTSDYFRILFHLPDFMIENGYSSFESIDNLEETAEKWNNYLMGKVCKDWCKKYTFIKYYYTILEFRDTREGLDRNLWRIEHIGINDERINKAVGQVQLNFWSVVNTETREYMKSYFKYLFSVTELAHSTIYNRFHRLSLFFNFFKDKSFKDITHKDIENYRISENNSASHNNHMMNDIKEFYKYLIANLLFDKDSPVRDIDFMQDDMKHLYNSVPDDVIFETFKYLHKLRKDYLLMYLINVFTGIRISDICQLKTDCLYKNKNGYFLAHDVQKMQDVGAIPIAVELYDLIQKRIKYANKNGYEYLFPSEKDKSKPYNPQTYRRNMKKIIQGWNIKMPDGSPYNFVTHAFRHTIATTLYKLGMPSSLIQLGVLHHVEINMSRSYVDIDNQSQLDLLKEKNLLIPAKMKIEKASESDSALANGFCHMPSNIHCPNMNACLNCDFFRTSIKFMDVHEQHLEELNERIEYYKSNGYTQNLAFAEADKEKLELIIAKLKEIKEDKIYDTDINKTG